MPRATLRIKSNDPLVTLSKEHPESAFAVLGAWPVEETLRVLIEASPIAPASLAETFSEIPTLTNDEIRHASEQTVLFEVSTPTPPSHGAMSDSGVVPSFPVSLEDGWFVGDLIASQEQLSAFRDELESGDIEYRLTQLYGSNESVDLLTDRQREIVELAVERGYYESPRRCSLTALAEKLNVNKSVVSRVLHRAEGRIVTAFWSSR